MIILRQKEYGERWNKFKYYAPTMTRGALKGALPGAVIGGVSSGHPVGIVVGAGLGAIAGAGIAKFWKGRYISPEEKREMEEKKKEIDSLIPKWYKNEIEIINKKINSAQLEINKLNKNYPLFREIFLPKIYDDIYPSPDNDDIVCIGNFNGNNPDDFYAVCMLTEINFLLNIDTGVISAEVEKGYPVKSTKLIIKTSSDIKKLIKFSPMNISDLVKMFGKHWEDDLEYYNMTIEDVKNYINSFNSIVKKI